MRLAKAKLTKAFKQACPSGSLIRLSGYSEVTVSTEEQLIGYQGGYALHNKGY